MCNSGWAVVEAVSDRFWEILARFAPESGTLYEPWVSHHLETSVRDIPPKG